MSIKKTFYIILYFIFSLLFIIISTELLLSVYFKSVKIPTDNRYMNRYMLFSEGKLFKDFKNFFLYEPNINRRSLQYYFEENRFQKIWDYELKTNNEGLVQSKDVFKNKQSILFLGDSFTEGQGAPPWVDFFEQKNLDYQIINGGIIGTGFIQFYNLSKYFKEKFQIKKIFVIYIGEDLRRGLSIPKNNDCLLNNKMCTKNFGIYSIPKDDLEIQQFLLKIHQIRKNQKLSFNQIFKNLIRSTYLYNISRSKINRFRFKNDVTIKKNFDSINKLINENKSKITFVNIKTAVEIIKGQESYETQLIREYLKKKKIPNYVCNMNNDLTNFYKIDFHPNQKGYKEIFLCLDKLLKEL